MEKNGKKSLYPSASGLMSVTINLPSKRAHAPSEANQLVKQCPVSPTKRLSFGNAKIYCQLLLMSGVRFVINKVHCCLLKVRLQPVVAKCVRCKGHVLPFFAISI